MDVKLDTMDAKQVGAHIISEDQQIIFHGIAFSQRIEFKKTSRYIIWNQKGIKLVERHELPFNHDPTFIRHSPKTRNYNHLVDNIQDVKFEAFKLNKNVKEPLTFDEKLINVKKLNYDDRFGEYKKYIYKLNNIQPDDTIEVTSSYLIDYNNNYQEFLCYRVFLQNNLYIESLNFNIIGKKKANLELYDFNNGKYDSISYPSDWVKYTWNKKGLAALNSDYHSRPYLELPYFILTMQTSDMFYRAPNSFIDTLIPPYAFLAMEREYDYINIVKSIDQGVKFKDYNLFYNFFNSVTDSIKGDSTCYFRLMTLKNHIAQNFSFDNDLDYYTRSNNFMVKFGKHAYENTIRDMGRYELYVSIIRKLEMGFFTAYMSDNRSGVSNKHFIKHMENDDYMLASITKDNQIQFIYPKFHNYGYLLNEMPFYFEGTIARLVHLGDYRGYGEPIAEELREIRLPQSSFQDNSRVTNVYASIDLEQFKIKYKSKVRLSGQFSTMTRGSYLHNYADSTVNLDYARKLWDFGSELNITSQDYKLKSQEFPFHWELNSTFETSSLNIINNQNNNDLKLDLRPLIQHITPNLDCDSKRLLDFYSDFTGQDTYSYILDFSQEVKLDEIDQKVSNNYGEYTIQLSELSPGKYKLDSYLAIKKEKISSEDIQQVCEIYNEIESPKWVEINLP